MVEDGGMPNLFLIPFVRRRILQTVAEYVLNAIQDVTRCT